MPDETIRTRQIADRDKVETPQTELADGNASDGIQRARPVKGKIDHAALSREYMARFPKIRARFRER